jgi:hypothetical protein
MRRAEANWAGAPRAPVMGTSRERSLLRSLGAFSEWATIRSVAKVNAPALIVCHL